MRNKTRIMAAFLALMTLFSALLPTSAISADEASFLGGAAPSHSVVQTSFSDPDPIAAIDNFLNAFYTCTDPRRGGKMKNQLDNGFWTDAEMLEVIIDAYERIGDPRYLQIAEQFYDGIIERRSEDWSWNDFNDDVFWMTLATIRLYKNTQNEEYRDVAIQNFEMCYARAWDTSYLGGGFWWKTTNHEKNGCVNGPGAMAALMIYDTTGDERYLNIGKEVMEWEFEYLFEEDTGKHLDNIDINGKINYWTNTGNQGNIIGPCTMLYKFTGEQRYFDYAKAAADHATTLGEGDLEILNEGGDSGDTIGGKGLLARWLGYFIRECDVHDYDEWMQTNAQLAWNMRNSQGLMWGEFSKKTLEDIQTTDQMMQNSNFRMQDYAAWGCSAAVSWLLNTYGLMGDELPQEDPPASTEPAVTTAPDADQNGSDKDADNGTMIVIIAVAAALVVVAGIAVVIVVVSKKKRQ